MQSTDAQVIVIGAGLAGLSTAHALVAQGIDVVVLEARDRIGGRVFSHTLPNGVMVDMGAQFVGPRQRRINALAKQAGATLLPIHSKGRTVRESASSLSLIDRFHIARVGWRLNKEASATPAVTPWTRKEADKLDALSTTQWLASIAPPAAATYWTQHARDAFCIDPQAVSALETLQHLSSMGGVLGLATADTNYLENGAGTLADYLAQDLSVKKNCAVESIDVSDASVRVNCGDSSLHANQVVLAVPPQIGSNMLSNEQLKTLGYIENPTQGEVVKTAMIYSSNWWQDKGHSGFTVSDEGPVSVSFNCTPPGANYGCLMAISCADKARMLSHDEQERINSVVEHTHKLLGDSTHKPLFTKSLNWSQEPQSLGGYSSLRKPGSWIKQSASPIPTNGPVHCAGSEFAEQWRSYMEGALESGERAAANVLRALNQV